MHSKELDIIMELMDELKDKMEYGPEDFEERLGRKKPQVDIVKIEAKEDPMEMKMGMDGEDREEMEGDEELMAEGEMPDNMLKKRLMKLRG